MNWLGDLGSGGKGSRWGLLLVVVVGSGVTVGGGNIMFIAFNLALPCSWSPTPFHPFSIL